MASFSSRAARAWSTLRRGLWAPRLTGLQLALAALAGAAVLWAATARQPYLYAAGCDEFGYARQAALFRAHGWFGGLDTRLDTPESRFLIETARAAAPDPRRWSLAIAPRCHNFNARSGAVILQYPPGAGLALSLFGEPHALARLVVLGFAALAALYVGLLAVARPAWPLALLGLGVVAATVGFLAAPSAASSVSILVSGILIPAASLLAFRAFPGGAARSRPTAALLLGLVCGFLVAVRLANAFLVAGYAAQVAFSLALWRPSGWRRHGAALALAAGGALLLGAVPVLTANWVNAGGPFHTTYSSDDALAPLWDWAINREIVNFYLTSRHAWGPAALVAIVLGIRVATLRRVPPPDGRFAATAGALVTLGASLLFFATHQVVVAYYLLPACLAAAWSVTAELSLGQGSRKAPALGVGWVSAALLPSLAVALLRLPGAAQPQPYPLVPMALRNPAAIVWGDVSTGSVLYYGHKYAAALVFADPCLQDRLVSAVALAGRPQYFLDDGPPMRDLILRLSARAKLVEIGEFDALRNVTVYKLASGSVPPVPAADWASTMPGAGSRLPALGRRAGRVGPMPWSACKDIPEGPSP